MKSLRIALAITLIAATAACGSTKSANPSTSEAQRLPIEWQYLKDLRTDGSEMAGGFSDDALLKLGRTACVELNVGTPLDEVVTDKIKLAKEEAGVTEDQATAFVASYVTKAILNFCPEMAPN